MRSRYLRAMAEVRDKPLEELEREITCAVYQGHYQQAKLLPCNHYYCGTCIEKLAERSRGKQLSRTQTSCELAKPKKQCTEPSVPTGYKTLAKIAAAEEEATAPRLAGLKKLFARSEDIWHEYVGPDGQTYRPPTATTQLEISSQRRS